MRRLIYQVAVGPMRPIYEACTASVARYCARHGIAHVVQREPILRIRPLDSKRSEQAVERLGYLPIFEKANAFGFLSPRDEVAVIDSDVYVRDGAPNLFDELEVLPIAFAGVVERDMPITEAYRQKIRSYSSAQYGPLRQDADWRWNADGAEFFNMGVMVLTRRLLPYLKGHSPEQFIRRPEFQRFVDGEGMWRWSTDQTLLNFWLKTSGIPAQRLSWRWNALFKGVRDECLRDAWFIHFFLSDHLPEKGAEVPDLVRRIEAGHPAFPDLASRG